MKILATYTGIGVSKTGAAEGRFILSETAINAMQSMKIGKEYAIDIKAPSKKRSINQNSYLWELIGEIDLVENGHKTKEDDIAIYINLLKMSGAKVETLLMKMDALQDFKDRTSEIYRAYEILEKFNVDGEWWAQVKCYYGSSKMRTDEMAKLIDTALSYASEIGIDSSYWRALLEAAEA